MRVWEGDGVSFSMLKLSFNNMVQNIKSKVMVKSIASATVK